MERRKCFLSPFPSSQSFTCSAPRYISKNISFYIAYIYIFTVALQDPTINPVFIILLCIYLPLGEWGVILFANEDACQGCRSSFTRGPKQTGEGVLRGESHTTGRPNMATKMAGNLSRCIHKGTRRALKLFRGTKRIFLIFSVLVCVFISKASFLFKLFSFSPKSVWCKDVSDHSSCFLIVIILYFYILSFSLPLFPLQSHHLFYLHSPPSRKDTMKK